MIVILGGIEHSRDGYAVNYSRNAFGNFSVCKEFDQRRLVDTQTLKMISNASSAGAEAHSFI